MEKNSNLELNSGVLGLLLNAHNHPTYVGVTRYHFKGDLCQMSTAQNVARQLGIYTDVEGGIPFVTSKEDFDTVTKYLINYQIEGWWHYVTHKEYCQIKGEYYFNGKYLPYTEILLEIADKFDIYVGKSDASAVLYATSKEDYDTIIEELDKILK